jgi:aryl-alcohol dehydrogenase-like predicted oxidoreductase
MQSGLLTDGFTAERVAALADDDWRRQAPEFQRPRLRRNLALRDALRAIAQRHHVFISSVAIAWTLTWPGVTGAIVGARSPKQVDGWIGAAALKLTENDLNEIVSAIRRTRAGAGPTRPRKPRELPGEAPGRSRTLIEQPDASRAQSHERTR